MKVKLLKKIRKRFSIEYYPNADAAYKYIITDHEKGGTFNDPFDRFRLEKSHISKNDALRVILSIAYIEYRKYLRRYKQSKITSKVWYNA